VQVCRALFLLLAHLLNFVETGKDMKSFILNQKSFGAAVIIGALTSPIFAAADGAEDAGVTNIFNYILGAGSLVFVGIGIWVLYTNLKR